jgi:hypothetical protein
MSTEPRVQERSVIESVGLRKAGALKRPARRRSLLKQARTAGFTVMCPFQWFQPLPQWTVPYESGRIWEKIVPHLKWWTTANLGLFSFLRDRLLRN